MSRPVTTVRQPDPDDYSEIIDVRSPAEFAEDHMPGAVNLYVLDDAERAEIGTLYKQVNPFEAKKLGASLITANISRWTREHFLSRGKDYKPLVYCWRGGQRSMSLATILARIGWDTSVVDGGYKQYRAWVRQTLDTVCPQLELIILAGLTGTAKTRLLHRLAALGEQVIDLEGAANHRGSLLGPDPEQPQPGQKYFESRLADTIRGFDPDKPVWIEAESNKIGNLHCPEALWARMKQAPVLEVTATPAARIEFLLKDYPWFVSHPAELKSRLAWFKSRHGKAQIEQWHAWIDRGQWRAFVGDILARHYDPSYQRSMEKNNRRILRGIHLEGLDDETLLSTARSLSGIRQRPDRLLLAKIGQSSQQVQ